MNKKLEELTLLADKIYNLSAILKDYCQNNSNSVNEIANLYYLAEYLHYNIDTLNFIFINMSFEEKI